VDGMERRWRRTVINFALFALFGWSMPGAVATPIVGPPTNGTVDRWPNCWQGEDDADAARSPTCVAADKGSVFFESRDGFVQRYAVVGPITGRDAAKLKTAESLRAFARGAPAKEVVGIGPRVQLAESERLPKRGVGPRWVLSAGVFAPVAVAATLRYSHNGLATVFVNAERVDEATSSEYMLGDDRSVAVDLVAGWNKVEVVLEQISRADVAWMMRVRGRDGLPLKGAAWRIEDAERPLEAAEGAFCRGLGAVMTARPNSETGWELEGRLRSPGLVAWPVPRALRLSLDGRSDPLGEVAPGLDAVAAGEAVVRALVASDIAGRVVFQVDGTPCASFELGNTSSEAARWRQAHKRVASMGLTTMSGAVESLQAEVAEIGDLLGRTSSQSPDTRRLEPLLDDLEGRLAAADKGIDPYSTPGFHTRAYRSPIDGTIQRYFVMVPSNHGRQSGPVPLVILSHGLNYSAEDMMSIAIGKPSGPGQTSARGRLIGAQPISTKNGAILVSHDGYGNAGQRAPGRVDVLHVLDDVQAHYEIDPDRVTISGFSLGGSVAFWVPLLYAERFAGAAPLCGYPNLHEYTSVKRYKKMPWEEALLGQEGIIEYVENGRQLPLRMIHGTKDNPSRSELIHDRYKALRYQSSLDLPEAGHNVWDEAFADGGLLDWLASQRRDSRPTEVVLKTARYRYAELDWLRIDHFASWGAFGELHGKAQKKKVQIQSKSVDGFTIRARLLPDRSDPSLEVIIDGQRLQGVDLSLDAHFVRGSDGKWVKVEVLPVRGKKAGTEGPLGDVFHDAWIAVYGTARPEEREANALTADRWRSPAPWIKLEPRVFADRDFDFARGGGKSLVLVGRPETNSVTAYYAPYLATRGIAFEAGAVVVGKKRFSGPGIGISVIVPRPDADGHYLVLHAGVDAEGTLSSRYLPELTPDLLVYDAGIRVMYGDRILGPRRVLHGGFFDGEWRLPGAAKGD